MANVYNAQEELDCAKKELHEFSKKENSPADLSRRWRNCLNHIDKCYEKLRLDCSDVKHKFQKIESKVRNLQKKDPLLKYLSQARDADNHSIQVLTDLEIIDVRPVDYIKLDTYDQDGSFVKSEQHPLFSAEYRLKPFTNRGVTYTPPLYHRGKLIPNSENPLVVGRLAIEFYQSIIDEAAKL